MSELKATEADVAAAAEWVQCRAADAIPWKDVDEECHAAYLAGVLAERERNAVEIKRYKDGFEAVSQKYEDLLVQLADQP